MCPKRLSGRPVPLGGNPSPVCGERFTGWPNSPAEPATLGYQAARAKYTTREGAALPLSPEGDSPRAA